MERDQRHDSEGTTRVFYCDVLIALQNALRYYQSADQVEQLQAGPDMADFLGAGAECESGDDPRSEAYWQASIYGAREAEAGRVLQHFLAAPTENLDEAAQLLRAAMQDIQKRQSQQEAGHIAQAAWRELESSMREAAVVCATGNVEPCPHCGLGEQHEHDDRTNGDRGAIVPFVAVMLFALACGATGGGVSYLLGWFF